MNMLDLLILAIYCPNHLILFLSKHFITNEIIIIIIFVTSRSIYPKDSLNLSNLYHLWGPPKCWIDHWGPDGRFLCGLGVGTKIIPVRKL